jgi:hypothetical protein
MLIYTGRKTRVGDHEFYSVGDVPIRVSTTVKKYGRRMMKKQMMKSRHASLDICQI